jgi:hypothetical protein
MCQLCTAAFDGKDLMRRAHVLQLLALIEDPDALPADAALRLAQEILALTRPDGVGFRCDVVVPSEVDGDDTGDWRPS